MFLTLGTPIYRIFLAQREKMMCLATSIIVVATSYRLWHDNYMKFAELLANVGDPQV
jgi:hypothetical protein